MALVVGLLPLQPGVSAAVDVRPITSACPTGQVPASGFRDIAGSGLAPDITCVAAYGVVRGTTSTTYEPTGTVSRGQLATYLAGLLRAAGRTRPGTLADRFPDDDSSVHEANIDWLASLGIVRGYRDGTYRPTARVTRAQAASYLRQTIDAVGFVPLPVTGDWFVDDERSVHEANIDALASAGIVFGSGSRYDPSAPLLRGPMAAFVARVLDLLVAERLVTTPFGVQQLTVTPVTATTPMTSTGTTNDRGAHEYQVLVPVGVERLSIVLLPASSVTSVGDVPRFAATTPVSSNAGTSIESVNGRAVVAAGIGAGRTHVADVVPRNGRVVFRVDSVSARDVVPVVFENTVRSSEQRLDLAAGPSPQAAAERVGVGGRITWQLAEPARGTNLPAGTVRTVDVGARTYTLDLGGDEAPEARLRWSTSDTFRYTATSVGSITRADFESWIGVGDRVDPSAYDPGSTTHTITGDVPRAPTGVSATTSGGSVTVTFVKPTNPVATATASTYRLQRAPVSSGSVGSYGEVAAISGSALARFTDTPSSSGTYAYRVVARSVTGESPASAASQATHLAQAPASTASTLTDNGPSGTGPANGVLDLGDRITVTFDRPVTVQSGWSVQLLDADGTIGTLGVAQATAVVSAGGTTLTITLTAGPAITVPGATTHLQVGAGGVLQVISAGGIGSGSAGWNLPRSGIDDGTHANSRVVVGRTLVATAPTGLVSTVGSGSFVFGRNEVQVLTATGNTGGSFQLRFAGQNTAALSHDSTAAQIEAALQGAIVSATGLDGGVRHVAVSPTGSWSTLDVGPMRFTFQGGLTAKDVGLVTIENASLTGSGTTPTVVTELGGVEVTGIQQGDTVTVHAASGAVLGSPATAGANGAVTVSLGSGAITPGTTYYVVATRAGVPLRSRTAVVAL